MWRKVEIAGLFAIASVMVTCHARVIETPRQSRMSLADPAPYYFHNNIDGHPGTYSYGYDVTDPATGYNQFRTEERYPNGTVIGSYGYVDSWGRPHRYRYIADEKGYRMARDPPYKSDRDPVMPSYISKPRPSTPTESYSTENSITWTRPKKPIKKKNKNKGFVSRPSHNFLGPPSLYAED